MTDRDVLVHVELRGKTILVGRLWTRARKGHETASFEYDRGWLRHPEKFPLDPALMLGSGTFHTAENHKLFGAIGDSAPDRWGRALMRRAERRRALAERRAPRTLLESDFLLQVNDETRQGALRFKSAPDGDFLATYPQRSIPPLVKLGPLLAASERIADEKDTDEDLKLLLAPGSSLGGARPKASVRDTDGALAIAKFPHKSDETDAVLWEAVALTLAQRGGIDIPQWRIVAIAKKRVLLLKRFDRVQGQRRPYLSAMSMLGARDNDQRSYLEIADVLRQHGAAPKDDTRQLWRRMVFNVLVSNTDDHLRNHGLLYEDRQGWRLSPAFDLNPVPVDIKPRILSTAITEDDATASLASCLGVAQYFGLAAKEARAVARAVGQAVAGWRQGAADLAIKKAEIDRMSSAFEHEDLALARSL